jgi:hypothetical protein
MARRSEIGRSCFALLAVAAEHCFSCDARVH